jgi:hypothetical protein
MENIKETIYRVMHDLGNKQKDSRSDEVGAWLQKTLSVKERRHISSYSEYKGILRLRVDSSSWIYHLNLKKEALLSGIRRCLPQVKDIRFFVSEKNEKSKTKSKKSQAGR